MGAANLNPTDHAPYPKACHTPLPWSVQEIENLYEDYYLEDLIVGPHGEQIAASVSMPRHGHLAARVDSHLIVRAVNCHDELVEALQEWVDYFDELERNADPDDPLANARKMYHGKRVEKSRAALAKATERPAL